MFVFYLLRVTKSMLAVILNLMVRQGVPELRQTILGRNAIPQVSHYGFCSLFQYLMTGLPESVSNQFQGTKIKVNIF